MCSHADACAPFGVVGLGPTALSMAQPRPVCRQKSPSSLSGGAQISPVPRWRCLLHSLLSSFVRLHTRTCAAPHTLHSILVAGAPPPTSLARPHNCSLLYRPPRSLVCLCHGILLGFTTPSGCRSHALLSWLRAASSAVFFACSPPPNQARVSLFCCHAPMIFAPYVRRQTSQQIVRHSAVAT
jgi:hypothetical protein